MSIADFAPAETGAAVLAHWNEVVDSANAADAHAIAADPHTQYQKEAERNAANGYAPLDAGSLVPVANLPAATEAAKGAVELATSAETTAGLAVQASDTRLSDARTPAAHAASHADAAGTDKITPASILAVKGPGTVTADRLMVFSDTTGYLAKQGALREADLATLAGTNALTGRNVFANGQRAMVSDALFGPPVAGAHLIGDEWIDASGTLWRCTTDATPGTWVQRTQSNHATWTGGAGVAADITIAAHWQSGAILDGFQVYEPAYGALWTWNATLGRWLGRQYAITVPPGSAAFTGNNTSGYTHLSDDYDYQLVEYSALWSGAAGTWDASNKWQIQLRMGSPTLGALANWSGLVEIPAAGTNGGRAAPAAGNDIHATSSYGILYFGVVKTGTTAGNLTVFGGTALVREVRK